LSIKKSINVSARNFKKEVVTLEILRNYERYEELEFFENLEEIVKWIFEEN
jgi:hypothetical protein